MIEIKFGGIDLKRQFWESQGLEEELNKSLSKNCETGNKVIYNAIGLAYSDMCRTLKGARNVDGLKKHVQEELSKGFTKYFNDKPPRNEKCFKNKHGKLCNSFLDCVKSKSGQSKAKLYPTYGQAQKVVNMTFKYLYCADSFKEGYFKYCHIPLDGFTIKGLKHMDSMEGIVKEALKKNEKETEKAWSSLDEDSYYKISDQIDQLFWSNDGDSFSYRGIDAQAGEGKGFATPLQAEFYIWAIEKSIDNAKALNRIFGDKNAKEMLQILNRDPWIDGLDDKERINPNILRALQ